MAAPARPATRLCHVPPRPGRGAADRDGVACHSTIPITADTYTHVLPSGLPTRRKRSIAYSMIWPIEVAWLHSAQGQRKFLPVETTGLEPLTPALQSRCGMSVAVGRCWPRCRDRLAMSAMDGGWRPAWLQTWLQEIARGRRDVEVEGSDGSFPLVGSWRTRRIVRRTFRRVYRAKLRAMHSSLARLGVDSPERHVRATALEIVAMADGLVRLNQMLRWHGLDTPFNLDRDEAWIYKVRSDAQRVAAGGDDGLAGVRKPRRPSPDGSGPAAEADPPAPR